MRYLLILLIALPMAVFSQEYPRIETSSDGKKTVVFTLDQAQEIDNKLDLLELLEKSRVECDSLDSSLSGVISAQDLQIGLMRETISEFRRQVSDKDSQIANQDQRLLNLEESNRLCEEQKSNKDVQIKDLQGDLKMQRIKTWVLGCGGLLTGLLIAVAL